MCFREVCRTIKVLGLGTGVAHSTFPASVLPGTPCSGAVPTARRAPRTPGCAAPMKRGCPTNSNYKRAVVVWCSSVRECGIAVGFMPREQDISRIRQSPLRPHATPAGTQKIQAPSMSGEADFSRMSRETSTFWCLCRS